MTERVTPGGTRRRLMFRRSVADATDCAALLAASKIAAGGYPLSRPAPHAAPGTDTTAGSAKDRAGRRWSEWEAPSIAGRVAARVLARFVI